MDELGRSSPLAGIGRPIRWIGNGCCLLGALLIAGGTVVFAAYGEFEPGFYIFGAIMVAIGLGIRWAVSWLTRGAGPEMPVVAGYVFMGFGAIAVAGGIVLTFDDPGGIALIVFGLVFIGAGWLARRLFATPDGMKKVAVTSHTLSTQTGSRNQTTYIHVPEDASDDEVAAARADALAGEVESRDDWASGRIEAQESRAGNWYFIAAILWSVLCVILAVVAWLWEAFIWLPAAAVGVCAVGLWVLAVRNRMRQQKFGVSHFAVDQMPARPGGPLTGTIETGVSKASPPADGFRVRLRCLHRYESQVRMGNSERHSTRRVTDVKWEGEAAVAGHASARHDGLTVAVAFDLPADQPVSTAWHSTNGVRWELEVSAAMPGIDYKATFVVPVQA
ncbi:MAG: hypothetical protein RIM84_13815 [Alphaproteobacteria bacterium]